MRHLRLVPAPAALIALVALLALLGTTSSTAAAGTRTDRPTAPLVEIKPAQLARGTDPSIAHIEGSTVVDGDTRVTIDADRVELLGRAGADYVVSATTNDTGSGPIVRVTSDGTQTVIAKASTKGGVATLSTDGARLAVSVPRRKFTATKVVVRSTTDGTVVASRRLPGTLDVLDLDSTRVFLGGDGGTVTWKLSADTVRTTTARRGYLADIGADRLASYDKDPYDGGCTVVSTLRSPGTVLWRSCQDRVQAFAPDGRRSATIDLLSDGIGPSLVTLRSNRGIAKAAYGVRRGYFGLLAWEDRKNLLLETYRRKQSALVRCTGATCVRASEVTASPTPRRTA